MPRARPPCVSSTGSSEALRPPGKARVSSLSVSRTRSVCAVMRQGARAATLTLAAA